jgi:sortase A
MSKQKIQAQSNKNNGKSFILFPIMFFILIYLILYTVLTPFSSSIISVADLFFSDNTKSDVTEYNSIFVPIDETNTDNKPEYINISEVEYPKYGDHFGQLIINDCSIDTKLFMGDSDVALRNGAGIYYGSFIPGYGRTILVAGHNNSVFNGLKNAEPGQEVIIKTNYGNYTYEITETAVKRHKDRSAYDLNADTENLIMYTCYPFDELGLTKDRYFVYAKFVSGPIIIHEDKEET